MQNTIWNLDKDKLQETLDTSNTIAEVILKIGLSLHGNNYKALNERVKQDNLSLDILNKNRKTKAFGGVESFDLDAVLTENSTYSKQRIKIRLVEEGLKDYKCGICNNIGEWNNQKLTLQLDPSLFINSSCCAIIVSCCLIKISFNLICSCNILILLFQ